MPPIPVTVFSTRPYERASLEAAPDAARLAFTFLEARLDATTAPLARGASAVSAFVNDRLDAAALATLGGLGVRLVALRCAGFNQVDLAAARAAGIAVARVPAYSPHAVAEHALALVLALNRRLHRALPRVREGNFSLDGLVGFDLVGKTVGVVGTGTIGRVFAKAMLGLGCRVLAHDPFPAEALRAAGVAYVPLDTLLAESDVVSLHCPLTPATRRLIDARALALMKPRAVLVNTGRGALVDTRALIDALKARRLGGLALDVYEEEEHLFFEDRSAQVIEDDVFMRLLTFPNVVVTAHQAFLTEEALAAIAATTVANVTGFFGEGPCHRVDLPQGP